MVDGSVTLTRDMLLKELRKALKRAKREDARALRIHKRAEALHLERFREACRRGLKWNYAEAAKHHFDVQVLDRRGKYAHRPNCPRSEVDEVERLLRIVATTVQEKFVIKATGQWRAVWTLLRIPERGGLC